MKYVVTGVDGKLAGRVVEDMLHQVDGSELIFTCPNPDRVPEEKKARWKQAGVTLRAASYDDEEQMTNAFSGGERLIQQAGPAAAPGVVDVVDFIAAAA